MYQIPGTVRDPGIDRGDVQTIEIESDVLRGIVVVDRHNHDLARGGAIVGRH